MRISCCFLIFFDPAYRLGKGWNRCSGITRSIGIISVTFRNSGCGRFPIRKEEVEEVSKGVVVYRWVVVVGASAVTNVDWELTRDSVWQ